MKTCGINYKLAFLLAHLVLVFTPAVAQEKPPVAVNDYAASYVEYPVTINVLANDYGQYGHTIKVKTVYGTLDGIKSFNDSCITYTSYFYFSGVDTIIYKILDVDNDLFSEPAYVYITVENKNFAFLDINNYKARINAFGEHFWDYKWNSAVPELHSCEIPRGSGKGTLFSTSFWIGGLDEMGNLHLAAEWHRGFPNFYYNNFDFKPGPVTDSIYYSITYDSLWNRVWKLNKSDIDYHKAHCWEEDYDPIEEIRTWPGNGDTSIGQASQLAPFFDRTNDGLYNPLDGDYPIIRGDQAIFFIFNDDRWEHSSDGEKIGVEIRGMAYGFDCPQDSSFYNSIFLHYNIINHSPTTYYNTYIGVLTDMDIGISGDDYIGSDVSRNSFFVYNGTSVDGNGEIIAYGLNPPAQSVTILGGSFIDPDGSDNPKTDLYGNPLCDESINGLNFNDDIVDNERYGMTGFIALQSDFYNLWSYNADSYYLLLNGIWKDSVNVLYGGNGRPEGGAYGPSCRFMYPGTTDPLNWGCGCVFPNGPVDWTQETAGLIPDDVYGVGIMGPFTFKPSEKQELDIAFVFGRDYINPDQHAAVEVMKQRIDVIRQAFLNDSTPCGSSFSEVEHKKDISKQPYVYPNPAQDHFMLKYKTMSNKTEYAIYNILGEQLLTGQLQVGNLHDISIANLMNGVYILWIHDGNAFYTTKIVKNK
jgi:hypothetical protein